MSGSEFVQITRRSVSDLSSLCQVAAAGVAAPSKRWWRANLRLGDRPTGDLDGHRAPLTTPGSSGAPVCGWVPVLAWAG